MTTFRHIISSIPQEIETAPTIDCYGGARASKSNHFLFLNGMLRDEETPRSIEHAIDKTGPTMCETLLDICVTAQRQNAYPATYAHDR